jgi:GTP-binding protein YchF
MKLGLVGFPGSGKSTVFNALTGLSIETGYGSHRGKPALGVVKVPDHRLDGIAKVYRPKKVTYAEITFVDVGGGGAAQGLDRGVLTSMRDVDALCHVVRAFPDPAGSAPSPLRSIRDLEAETILADLDIVERRVERLRKDLSNPRELELLGRIQPHLEEERPIRAMELAPEEIRLLSGFQFLSQKPLLLVLNVAEERAAEPAPAEVVGAARERGLGLVVLSAQVEMDIAQMPEEEQQEFLDSLGLKEPAVRRFIKAAFELLDLITMLTTGDECRAWPIPRGTAAPKAAGKVHTDMERGFIRAEVMRYEDLAELGSEAKCRDAGLLRVEGKDYVVQDGDVIRFRFNV